VICANQDLQNIHAVPAAEEFASTILIRNPRNAFLVFENSPENTKLLWIDY